MFKKSDDMLKQLANESEEKLKDGLKAEIKRL